MRKRRGWCVVVVAALLGACSTQESGLTTSSTTDGTQTPEFLGAASRQGVVVQSASGGGRMVLEVFGFTIPQVLGFNARKYADGNVSGHINYRQTFEGETFHFVATVTCMAIYDGNRVKYGGVLTKSTDPTVAVGEYMWFQSIDNGQGAASSPDLSTGSGFGTEAENEAFCAASTPPNPLFLAELNGNIQVRDQGP